jgi:hypothetical protein
MNIKKVCRPVCLLSKTWMNVWVLYYVYEGGSE